MRIARFFARRVRSPPLPRSRARNSRFPAARVVRLRRLPRQHAVADPRHPDRSRRHAVPASVRLHQAGHAPRRVAQDERRARRRRCARAEDALADADRVARLHVRPVLGRDRDAAGRVEASTTISPIRTATRRRNRGISPTSAMRGSSAATASPRADASSTGVQFGVVLPTGPTNVTNAEGVSAERSLQPGTGATSGVLGLYANYAAHDGSLWFAQLQFQGAMATKDDYRPGNQLLAHRRRFVARQRQRGAARPAERAVARPRFRAPTPNRKKAAAARCFSAPA